MGKGLLTGIAGALALVAAGCVVTAALVPLPAWLAGVRLLAVALTTFALCVVTVGYLAVKVFSLAAGRLPLGAALPAPAPAAARVPVPPRMPPANVPPPRPPAASCSLEFVTAPGSVPETCGLCAQAAATFRCRVHALPLCGRCLPIHVSAVG
jgi:hypothetical protein